MLRQGRMGISLSTRGSRRPQLPYRLPDLSLPGLYTLVLGIPGWKRVRDAGVQLMFAEFHPGSLVLSVALTWALSSQQ